MSYLPIWIRFLPHVLVPFLLTSYSVLAQDNGAKIANKVEFRVTRFDPNDRKSPVFHAGSEGKKVEIEVPLTYIAGPFEVSLRDGIFLDLTRGGAEKPEISIEISPAEHKNLLLVFFQQDDAFKVLKILTPSSRIKGGDRFIINVTQSDMAIKFGQSKPLTILPGKSGILSGLPGSAIVSLPVLISLKQQDKWEIVSTENWPCDSRFRKYLFAYMSPRSRQLVFHSVTERM